MKSLGDIYYNITSNLEKIEDLEYKESDILFNDRTCHNFENTMLNISEQFNVLINDRLFDDTRTILLRNKTAEIYLRMAILFNNILKKEIKAKKILEEAKRLVSDKNIENQIIKTIKYNSVLNPIRLDFENGRIKNTFNAIDAHLISSEIDENLKSVLRQLKTDYYLRIETYGIPIKSSPELTTFNGMGLKMYGDTLYFVLFFIPLFPLTRYVVTYLGNNEYQFYGKRSLLIWQKYWLWVALSSLIWIPLLIIIFK